MGGIVKSVANAATSIVSSFMGIPGQQPQMSPPPPPPPIPATPPGPEAPVQRGEAAGNQSAGARAAGSGGFGSTIITGPEGLKAGSESTSKKQLLGS